MVMAPDGINELFTGGGDWRRLPLTPVVWLSDDSAFELALSEMEGVRRWRFRYAVDDSERGREGRCGCALWA